jgi:hypothetical protein
VTENFPTEVQSVVGPLLADLGFTLDEIDDNVDGAGGRVLSSITAPTIARCKSINRPGKAV